MRTAVLSYADGGLTQTAVLRRRRSYADGARGTCPSGLPFSAAVGIVVIAFACCPARQNDNGPGGRMRQMFCEYKNLYSQTDSPVENAQ